SSTVPAKRETMSKPDWYLDWRDTPVAIVASGPSAKKVNFKALEGRITTVAIKENIDLCPWAAVLYGCDAAWWRNAMGRPSFNGLKVAHRAHFSDVRHIKIDPRTDALLMADDGTIGSGGNSGFQALNMALQFGARR